MRQPFDRVDLPYKLRNFLLLEAFKPDPLHSDHFPSVQVERAIHSSKLSASDTITKLLKEKKAVHRLDIPAASHRWRTAYIVRWWLPLLPYDQRLPGFTPFRHIPRQQIACACLLARCDAKADHTLEPGPPQPGTKLVVRVRPRAPARTGAIHLALEASSRERRRVTGFGRRRYGGGRASTMLVRRCALDRRRLRLRWRIVRTRQGSAAILARYGARERDGQERLTISPAAAVAALFGTAPPRHISRSSVRCACCSCAIRLGQGSGQDQEKKHPGSSRSVKRR